MKGVGTTLPVVFFLSFQIQLFGDVLLHGTFFPITFDFLVMWLCIQNLKFVINKSICTFALQIRRYQSTVVIQI